MQVRDELVGRGDCDDARGCGGLEVVQEEIGEEEVTQVVDPHVHLEPILGHLSLVRVEIDASIVDEKGQLRVLCGHLGGKSSYGR